MQNVLRTLIYGDEVSLTIIDATALVKEGQDVHALNTPSADLFARTLAFTAFMASGLKNENGEVSLSLKGDGSVKSVSVSANAELNIRGAIDGENGEYSSGENGFIGAASVCFENAGYFTVIRSDGYARPFVGACEAEKGEIDASFESYFSVSEQLPTTVCTKTEFDEKGKISFCGLIALQPLPFVSQKAKQQAEDRAHILSALETLKECGAETTATDCFAAEQNRLELKTARYKCNCSREYLSGVIVSLGKKDLEEIVKEQGSVKVHCHYCNKNYEFFQADIDKLFP